MSAGASERIALRCTDIGHRFHEPSSNSEVNHTCKHGCNDLHAEHITRRNLEIMSELQVADKGKTLSHADITIGLEGNVCDGVSGHSKTDNEFSNDIETRLLVSNSLNDTDRKDEEPGECHGQDNTPPWKLQVPDIADGEADSK